MLGISSAFIIFLLITFELSFDNFHENSQRVYRVLSGKPGEVTSSGTPHGLAGILDEEIAGIDRVAVIHRPNNIQFEIDGEIFREKEVYYTTPSFFNLFDFKWKQGNPEAALSKPGQVVLTQSMAEKYFNGNALGKQLRINNTHDVIVTGIIADVPENTNFPIDIIISQKTFEETSAYEEEYQYSYSTYYETYVLLDENADPRAVESQLQGMVKKHLGNEIADNYLAHELQPLHDIHYNKEIGANFAGRAVSKGQLRNLSIIGAFILLIAAVNFINLSTAQAVKRSKEVGIRKVLGSQRKQLVLQFLTETFTIVFAATFISWILVYTFQPVLNKLIGLNINQQVLFSAPLIIFLVTLLLLLTFLSGFYPAFILSRSKPLETFKKKISTAPTSGFALRKVLVGFQFVIAQLLIICTVVMLVQLYFFNSKDLGFEKENILLVNLPDRNKEIDVFKNNLATESFITDISLSLNAPTATSNKLWQVYSHPSLTEERRFVEIKFIDSEYLEMYDITLLAGRNVRKNDESQIVVNERFLHDIGIDLPAEALGEQFDIAGEKLEIVGVVKDFHTMSLHMEIFPLVLKYDPDRFEMASFKVDMHKTDEAVSRIAEEWKALFPNQYFTYEFLEEDLAGMYEEENKASEVLTLFTIIAIGIGCLGLYGLVSYITIQKTKEISIRKILGASLENLLILLNKDFLVLFCLAFLVAAPAGFYLMTEWLSEYPYHIDMEWWMFAASAAVGLFITALTVSVRSLRAAMANPVDSLYSE